MEQDRSARGRVVKEWARAAADNAVAWAVVRASALAREWAAAAAWVAVEALALVAARVAPALGRVATPPSHLHAPNK